MKEIYPSSYVCECGYRADFFENTINEMRALSRKKRGRHTLGCDDSEHTIVFEGGEAVEMTCSRPPRT